MKNLKRAALAGAVVAVGAAGVSVASAQLREQPTISVLTKGTPNDKGPFAAGAPGLAAAEASGAKIDGKSIRGIQGADAKVWVAKSLDGKLCSALVRDDAVLTSCADESVVAESGLLTTTSGAPGSKAGVTIGGIVPDGVSAVSFEGPRGSATLQASGNVINGTVPFAPETATATTNSGGKRVLPFTK